MVKSQDFQVQVVIECSHTPSNTELFQVFQLGDGSYKMMFHFLWSLKRVEFCMSNFRKEQTCMLKKLQRRTDFQGMLQINDLNLFLFHFK